MLLELAVGTRGVISKPSKIDKVLLDIFSVRKFGKGGTIFFVLKCSYLYLYVREATNKEELRGWRNDLYSLQL